MEPYRSYFPHAGLLLPETNRLTQKVMSLPTGTAISSGEIVIVCSIIRLAIEQGRELVQRLPVNLGSALSPAQII
jgi:dTDP-4-amino-4,6-dideoxygalactose transaminase